MKALELRAKLGNANGNELLLIAAIRSLLKLGLAAACTMQSAGLTVQNNGRLNPRRPLHKRCTPNLSFLRLR